MPYVPHTGKDIEEMLQAVGAKSLDDQFRTIPEDIRLKSLLNLPSGLSEQELTAEMKKLAGNNVTVDDHISFISAGAYNHYIPSVVNHTLLRSEFYTSYTPYQPEISQGTLQAIFEYQTLICQLTGMDAANASMYEGASATAEAVLMAGRINNRKKVVVSSALHPEYREVVSTYLKTRQVTIEEIMHCTEAGMTLPEAVERHIDEETSCLVIQQPNFFGCLEDLKALGELVRKNGAIFIVVISEPVSMGLLKSPGELGADIVIGEGQSLGIALSFGGPYLGFFATREKFMRQMPGRLVGETTDKDGNRGFILTLSTREQHIRREKATSNICTNEGLCALAATVYMCMLGKKGMMELARLNLSKAEYLKKGLQGIKGVKLSFNAPTFNEFVIEVDRNPEELLKALSDKGIWGGISMKRFYPHLDRHILLCATEMNTKEDMDKFVKAMQERQSLFTG
ncbi:MAG: aminomethyl-transferring glycine dehydrogenase subunit GcvPA [Deltaproteobacteria bacterium]|nr:aminomethyl-transferring glycine dehydrogenase subunit GcvPA [Deltaproteobacteria bacterium]